ncbi:hypothetical protein [Shewanella sp.]|uniref:hypothetical protein n=1 Tax=Shewanella sp. TaxID=50422 RepID=UPI003D1246FD
MSIIYTYVVDHGEEAPTVGAGTTVNGGHCIGVTFDDLQEQAELMEEKLRKIADIVEYVPSYDVESSIKQVIASKSLAEIEEVMEQL